MVTRETVWGRCGTLSWQMESKFNGPEVSKNCKLCGWNRKQRAQGWAERMLLWGSGSQSCMASNDGSKVEK